jgi:hypothetical protein
LRHYHAAVVPYREFRHESRAVNRHLVVVNARLLFWLVGEEEQELRDAAVTVLLLGEGEL